MLLSGGAAGFVFLVLLALAGFADGALGIGGASAGGGTTSCSEVSSTCTGDEGSLACEGGPLQGEGKGGQEAEGGEGVNGSQIHSELWACPKPGKPDSVS